MSTFPTPPAAVPPTSTEVCDAYLERLAARKEHWLTVSNPERCAYLKRCLNGVMDVADAWAKDGSKLKGIQPGTVYEGEEWLAGPMTTVRNIRLLIEAIEANGQPKPPKVRQRPDGQKVVDVFPTNLYDRILFTGVSAEVWVEPGQPASQGQGYRNRPTEGKVNLTLGAGNVSSIPPMDILYKLFVEDEVVILKMNPVNEHVGPKLERAFRALIDDGYLAIVYGGVEVGKYLTDHPLVDTLHVTGSDKTYDAIVWGPDPAEQARRKSQNEPVNARPFTAELGCVTPVMVVPGEWSESDMTFQARNIVGMVTQNASFNCNAAKVVVVANGWPQRERFLQILRETLRAAPPRKAYYPGAQKRYEGFLSAYPQAEVLGKTGDEIVPWTFIPDVPAQQGEYALVNEAFCGVLAEVSIDADDAKSYLSRAVPLCNEVLWGTLSCMMIVHPKTERAHKDAVEQAIADLEYGAVAVNTWAGMVYGLVVTTWGAFPGHPPQDIQSGTGVVHNSYLIDHPQKTVVRSPFKPGATPVWFADHKTLDGTGKRLTDFEAKPGIRRMVALAANALRG
ncbi:MAG: aldehyde dehydrogenase family protein [Myxococcota bacterium]